MGDIRAGPHHPDDANALETGSHGGTECADVGATPGHSAGALPPGVATVLCYGSPRSLGRPRCRGGICQRLARDRGRSLGAPTVGGCSLKADQASTEFFFPWALDAVLLSGP